METIELGSNINWNRTASFTALAQPRNSPDYPGRIPPVVKFIEENRFIVTVGHSQPAKPWWISAGKLLVELDFEFDATSGLGNRLLVHQQQLLLDRANLVYIPRYIFPYTVAENKHKLTFHFNKWLLGVNVEIFQADF